MEKFLKENGKTNTKLDLWMQFICQKNKKELMEAMAKNKEIKKANSEYEILVGDEYVKRIAYLREKAIMDANTEKSWAKEEGIMQNKIDTAKKLLKKGMDLDEIQEITGLTKKEVKKIKYELSTEVN